MMTVISRIRNAITVRQGMGFAALGVFLYTLFQLNSVSSYPLFVFLYFIACLSAFHVILAFWQTITKTFVKATDYAYFSFTVIGIILAAVSQGVERDLSYANFVRAGISTDPEKVVSEVKKLISWCDDHIPWLDETGRVPVSRYVLEIIYGDKLHPKICNLLHKIDEVLYNKRYSEIPDFVNSNMSWSNIKLIMLERQLYPFQLDPFQFDPHTTNYKLGLMFDYMIAQTMRLNLEAVYYQNPEKSRPTESSQTLSVVLTKLFYSQAWPIILALAIAIRMTKVTADVSEWPIDRPKRPHPPAPTPDPQGKTDRERDPRAVSGNGVGSGSS